MQTINNTEIKSCPFCNCGVDVTTGLGKIRYFKCSCCGAVVSFDSEAANRKVTSAIELWNRRANDAEDDDGR